MANLSELYTDLPKRTYSIREFNAYARELLSEGDNLEDSDIDSEGDNPEDSNIKRDKDMDKEQFIRFTLTGEVPGDHQVVVDPLRNYVRPEDYIKVSRDYDSFLGISENIAVTSSLCIYPINNPSDALRTSIHLKRSIADGQETRSIPYHQIPNIKLGFWGPRHSIHIFFPRLALNERSSPLLTELEISTVYEKGLQPYLISVSPETSSDFPPDFNAEKFRAAKRGGQHAFRTVVLSGWTLGVFAEGLRRELKDNKIEWAEGFFFLHTIRGMKRTTLHNITYEGARIGLEDALKDAQIPRDAISQGSWWVDVGVEFCSGEVVPHCLQWMTVSHHLIVKDALQIDQDNAERITKLGSKSYSRDLASHLPGVSGFRIEPGPNAEGRYQAAYLHCYTTDKSVTYHPNGHSHAKEITVLEAMGDVQPTPFIKKLFDAYLEAANRISSNARIEVRVPIGFAEDVLVEINEIIFRKSLLSFPTPQWWGFRSFRLLAISTALSLQANGQPEHRVKREALLLTAACVWLVNALHARPDDGPSSRDLMKAVLPLTNTSDDRILAHARRRAQVDDGDGDDGSESNDQEFDVGTPCYQNGAIFIRRIMVGPAEDIPVPRMRSPKGNRGGPFIAPSTFQYFFKVSEEEICHIYGIPGFKPSDPKSSKRPSNRTKCTPTYAAKPGSSEPFLFDLAERGYRLPPPVVDNGSDNEVDPGDRGFGSGNINQDVTKLWRQFLVDMINKAPNPADSSLDSYCKLTPKERLEVQESFYQNMDLSQVWNACHWREAEDSVWDRAFRHLFPPIGHKIRNKVQNYYQCQYYRNWKFILDKANPESAKAIRQSLKNRVLGLGWLPDASQDKMWPTKGLPRFTRYPQGSEGAAPRIILHGKPRLNDE